MDVISLSVDERTLQKIDRIDEIGSFEGRSELIRKGVDRLHSELIELEDIEGKTSAVLVVRHPQKDEKEVSEITHDFGEIVRTQFHDTVSPGECLEILRLQGNSTEIKDLFNRLEGSSSTDSVQIYVE